MDDRDSQSNATTKRVIAGLALRVSGVASQLVVTGALDQWIGALAASAIPLVTALATRHDTFGHAMSDLALEIAFAASAVGPVDVPVL